jgi:type I restriction enzyme S subunit
VKGWAEDLLGNVCDVARGTTITQKQAIAGNVPVVAGGIIPTYFHSIANRLANTITISGSGANAGYVNFYNVPIFASDCSTVRPKEASGLDVHFVHYFLKSQQQYISTKLRQGAAQPHVYARDIAKLPIKFPPLPDQQRIVALLDQAFAGLATATTNAEKNFKNARELFESYLNSIFAKPRSGWVRARLSDICEKISDGTHQTPKYSESGFIFLSSKNVTSGVIDWKNVRYIDAKQHKEMQKRISPRVDDILLAKNGTTGVAAIVDRKIPFDIYVSLALLRPRKNIYPKMLLHFINSGVAKKQFTKRLKGIGVPNLHLQEIREVEITYPEAVLEQQRLAAAIDELRAEYVRLEILQRRKITSIASLKQSILQKAFSGELTAPPLPALKEAAE